MVIVMVIVMVVVIVNSIVVVVIIVIIVLYRSNRHIHPLTHPLDITHTQHSLIQLASCWPAHYSFKLSVSPRVCQAGRVVVEYCTN